MAHTSTTAFTEKKVVIGGETIAYYDNEKGETTLLFVHGAFIKKEYWNAQLAAFSSTYRVVALDLAGHGNSSGNGNDWSFEKYGHNLNEFISKLALNKVIIIGHSNGADIMIEAVAENSANVIGIVGVDYFKNVGVPLPEEMIKQTIASLKADFANTNENYAKQALLTAKTNHAIADRVVKDFREMSPGVGIPFNESAFNYTIREVELLKKLHLKLHLINADYVPTNEENLKKQVGDNYDLNIINGTSHFPMIENSEAFNKALKEVLSKIKPS